jgi:hypothetical protein
MSAHFFACSASKKSGLDTRVYGSPFFLVAPANGKLMFAQYCFSTVREYPRPMATIENGCRPVEREWFVA